MEARELLTTVPAAWRERALATGCAEAGWGAGPGCFAGKVETFDPPAPLEDAVAWVARTAPDAMRAAHVRLTDGHVLWFRRHGFERAERCESAPRPGLVITHGAPDPGTERGAREVDTTAPETSSVARWAERYRREAAADGYRVVIEDLKDYESDASEDVDQGWDRSARLRIEGTIECVAYLLACKEIDGVAFDRGAFLRRQVYAPTTATTRYRVDFERSRGYAVIFVDELTDVDLADLFNGRGYREARVSHVDRSPLGADEREAIAAWVREDFAYDFEPDEFSYTLHQSRYAVQVLDFVEA